MATSTTFIAVYRGPTIGEAHLLAVTTDPDLVREVVTRLLGSSDPAVSDPAVQALEKGRREALKMTIESSEAPR